MRPLEEAEVQEDEAWGTDLLKWRFPSPPAARRLCGPSLLDNPSSNVTRLGRVRSVHWMWSEKIY